MKKIATLFLAIVMIVSMLTPISAFADVTVSDNLVVTVATNQSVQIKAINDANSIIGTATDATIINLKSNFGSAKPTVPAEDSGKNVLVESGSWTTTSGKGTTSGLTGPFGANDHLYASSGNIKFKLTNIEGGDYKVLVWVMRYASAGNDFGVQIRNDGKTLDEVRFTGQAAWGNTTGWVEAGSYSFNGNTEDEWVNIIPHGTTRISAVAFVPTTIERVQEEIITLAQPFSTTTQGASATFNPTKIPTAGAAYDVSFYKDLDDTENVAQATAKFVITNAGKTETIVYNFSDNDSDDTWIDLGRYTFAKADGQGVVVSKADPYSGALKATKVKFTPVEGVATARAIDRDLEGIVVTNPSFGADKWKKNADTADDLYYTCGPTGLSSYVKTGDPADAYIAYDAQSVPAGKYDVYWYAVVTDANKDAVLDTNVYASGLHDKVALDYSKLTLGTKEWVKVGTYTFAGNTVNEYISVGGVTVPVYGAGVKFVAVEDDAEPIVLMTSTGTLETLDDAADYFTFGPVSKWNFSATIKNINGTYSTAYANDSGAWGKISTKSVAPGRYKVDLYSVCYFGDVREDDQANIIITANGKESRIPYDNTNGGSKASKWITLGEYTFTGADGEGVALVAGDSNTGTSMRYAGIRLTPVDVVEEVYDEFIIPPVASIAAGHANATTDAYKAYGFSAHGNSDVDGLIHTILHKDADATADEDIKAVSMKYYLPNYTENTRAGLYEVYTIALPFSSGEDQAMPFSVHSKAGNTEPTELTYSHYTDGNQVWGWKKIGEWNFLGGSNGEYVEFKRAAGLRKNSRYGAVKFVWKAPLEIGETGLKYTAYQDGIELDGVNTLPTHVNKGTIKTGFLFVNESRTKGVIVDVYNDSSEDVVAPVLYAAYYNAEGTKIYTAKQLMTGITTIGSAESASYYVDLAGHKVADGDYLVIYAWDDNLVPVLKTPIKAVTVNNTH